MPKLIIDDREVVVPPGTKVIEAAERLGIMIPRFCYHEAMGSVGACRMCAVKFIQGPFKGVQMSCMIDVQDGMVVSTTDEEAVKFRKYVIEWLMLNHPHDCPVCDEGGQCLLQDETVSGGHGIRRYTGKKRTYRDQNLGVFIAHEMNRCIHCYRCSRFYQEFSGYRDLGTMQIGRRVYFGRYEDGQLESPFSGNLVDICPTGVYTDRTARFKVRRWHLQRSPSLCIHCSLGCNTIANAHFRAVMRVEARFNDAVNGHFICDPGRFAFSYTNGGEDHNGRPWYPRSRAAEMSFEKAMETAALKLTAVVNSSGPGAVACVGSTRSSLETQAMLKHFCRALQLAGPSFFIDPALERKVRSAVSRLDGRVAMSLREIQKEPDFILAIGVDPLNEAPMLAFSMRQAHRRQAKVALIDPRPVSMPLDFVHISVPPRAFDACLGHIARRAIPRADVEKLGPEALGLYDSLPADPPADPPPMGDLIETVSGMLASSRRPLIVCGTDVSGESTPVLAADLAALMSGAKDRVGLFYLMPGASAFSAGLLLGDGEEPSSFLQILEGIESGKVKALIVVESDPFRDFPDRQRLDCAIQSLDTLVVFDHLMTGAVRRADVFLPTSTVYEMDSTYVNQEGRVQFAQRAHHGGIPIWGAHPPRVFRNYVPGGDHRPGWEALDGLLKAMSGAKKPLSAPAGTTPSDTTGKSAAEVPVEDTTASSARLPGRSPWTVVVEESAVLAGLEPEDYPFDGIRILPERSKAASFASNGKHEAERTPGTGLDLLLVEWIYGTDEIGAYSQDILGPVTPEPFMLLHTADAAEAGLADGDRVVLHLEGGRLEISLKASSAMARGVAILPRHWNLEWQKLRGFADSMPLERNVKA